MFPRLSVVLFYTFLAFALLAAATEPAATTVTTQVRPAPLRIRYFTAYRSITYPTARAHVHPRQPVHYGKPSVLQHTSARTYPSLFVRSEH